MTIDDVKVAYNCEKNVNNTSDSKPISEWTWGDYAELIKKMRIEDSMTRAIKMLGKK